MQTFESSLDICNAFDTIYYHTVLRDRIDSTLKPSKFILLAYFLKMIRLPSCFLLNLHYLVNLTTCGPPAPCHHRTVQERSADLRTCCMLQPTSMHTQRKQNGGFEPKLGYPPIEKGLFFLSFWIWTKSCEYLWYFYKYHKNSILTAISVFLPWNFYYL